MVLTHFCANCYWNKILETIMAIRYPKISSLPPKSIFFLICSCCHLNFNFFNCDKRLFILNTTSFSFGLAWWLFSLHTPPWGFGKFSSSTIWLGHWKLHWADMKRQKTLPHIFFHVLHLGLNKSDKCLTGEKRPRFSFNVQISSLHVWDFLLLF